MAIALSDEARKQALASLQRFWRDHLDGDISDIQAFGLLDFILKEIAPSAYNAGVADAQAYFQERVADLEGVCYEPEFTFWPKSSSVRRKAD